MDISDSYALLQTSQRLRVSDGHMQPILADCQGSRVLLLVWPQLGDFDSLEYAWWIQREQATLAALNLTLRAVGIGNQASGQAFCQFTHFPPDALYVDPTGSLHQQLGLYRGLAVKLPGLSGGQTGWLNLMLMCAGIASPGTLAEVLRGYTGDRRAPQLIADPEEIHAKPLPLLRGSFFGWAGGKGFQRPFELATLRLRNMAEVLSHWSTYVPDASHLPQRGGTFLFNEQGQLLYHHRDPGILGFAADKSRPLSFLEQIPWDLDLKESRPTPPPPAPPPH
jgi:hypothetical protein